MGNAVSDSNLLYTEGQLQWKTGSLTDGVPAPNVTNEATYENLQGTSDFKEYLMQNIDSDALLASIISGTEDNSVLLKGFDKFHAADREIMIANQSLLENIHLCSSAGVDVSQRLY
jgi:hypothetical protein